jgi:serine/threonine-protein kinase TTK/MPS1
MGPGCKIYALKRIKLAGRDEEAASGFIDEINLLNSLRDKPNIIQLVESQVGRLLLALMLLGGKERG